MPQTNIAGTPSLSVRRVLPWVVLLAAVAAGLALLALFGDGVIPLFGSRGA